MSRPRKSWSIKHLHYRADPASLPCPPSNPYDLNATRSANSGSQSRAAGHRTGCRASRPRFKPRQERSSQPGFGPLGRERTPRHRPRSAWRRQELVLPSANSCFQGMRWPTCYVAGKSTIHPTDGYRTAILKVLASIRFALFSFGGANCSLAPECAGCHDETLTRPYHRVASTVSRPTHSQTFGRSHGSRCRNADVLLLAFWAEGAIEVLTRV